MRLLLVEDDAGIGRFVRQGLVEAGYDIDWERDGTRGLERALSGVHDLLILDVLLPDLNGLELLAKARAAGLKTHFMGVNSGSYQIAKGLGTLAHGMVFSQVVPSPYERKRVISREYQEAAKKAPPNPEFNYGALEGYMTAKMLVMALRNVPGRDLSRASLVKSLYDGPFDLGGITVRYEPGFHEGARFVDLSVVARDGRFIH